MSDIVSKKYIQRAIDVLRGQRGEEGRLAVLEDLLDTATTREENRAREALAAKRKARGHALLRDNPVFGGTHG